MTRNYLHDGRELYVPQKIKLAEKTAELDELEYEIWNLYKQYFVAFGITIDGNDKEIDEPDWYLVKELQENLIDSIKKLGIPIEPAIASF